MQVSKIAPTKKWLLGNGFKKTESTNTYILDTPLGMRFRVILEGSKMGLTIYKKGDDTPKFLYNFPSNDIAGLKLILLHHI